MLLTLFVGLFIRVEVRLFIGVDLRSILRIGVHEYRQIESSVGWTYRENFPSLAFLLQMFHTPIIPYNYLVSILSSTKHTR